MCPLVLALRLTAAALHVPVPEYGLTPWFTVAPGNLERARIVAYLESRPGKHLVIVRYQPDHDLYDEWVHNDAAVDVAPIVWAREADPETNRQLRGYFAVRRVWLLEADTNPPKLTELSSGESR
jgi:hypothetical protein